MTSIPSKPRPPPNLNAWVMHRNTRRCLTLRKLPLCVERDNGLARHERMAATCDALPPPPWLEGEGEAVFHSWNCQLGEKKKKRKAAH